MKIRFMMPMSVRCNSCGEYIYRGKKFNARKETVDGEEYLGIRVHRFYVRCPSCSSEFTIKTDPQNTDYIAELGASRNFEPWKEEKATVEEAKQDREEEEKHDAMKALENRTKDSKREIDILEALDEIRAANARANQISVDQLWEQHMSRFEEQALPDEDEELLQSIKFKNASDVRRLDEEEEEGSAAAAAAEGRAKKPRLANPDAAPAPDMAGAIGPAPAPAAPTNVRSSRSPRHLFLLPVRDGVVWQVLISMPAKKVETGPKLQVVVKPRSAPAAAAGAAVAKAAPKPAAAKPAGAAASMSLLGAYGGDSD